MSGFLPTSPEAGFLKVELGISLLSSLVLTSNT